MSRVEIDDTAIDALFDEVVPREMERRAFNVENRAKRLVVQHGGGRVYDTRFWRDSQGRLRRGGRRVPHQASAPGQPPATDTGRLLASIHHILEGEGQHTVAHVGSDVNYALFLELGTRYMAARPFLRPALYSAVDSYAGLTNSLGEEYF